MGAGHRGAFHVTVARFADGIGQRRKDAADLAAFVVVVEVLVVPGP